MPDEPTATERVRTAFAARQAPSRRDYERALRDQFGMPARLARRVASETMRMLRVPDDVAMLELAESVAELVRKMHL